MNEVGLPALRVREELAGMTAYSAPPQPPARYRMNGNESPYPPPRALVEELADELRDVALNRYPDKDAGGLYEAISSRAGWPREGLWVANGSNEVFLHLCLAFGGAGRASMTFEPTYPVHTVIARITGTRPVQVERGDELAIELDAAIDAIRAEKPEIVIVCSPNNPTGDATSLAVIAALLDEVPGLLVVDEAYAEFTSPAHSAVGLLGGYPNLVVMRTFSKAWRLAGVRIGYMQADPSLIAELTRVRLPYHLSALTQAVGEAAIRHSEETLDLARSIAAERDRITLELQGLGIKTFVSEANFVLFEVEDPRAVWDRLLERGILVRGYFDTPGLDRCLRVTAGLGDETSAFIEAMTAIVEAA